MQERFGYSLITAALCAARGEGPFPLPPPPAPEMSRRGVFGGDVEDISLKRETFPGQSVIRVSHVWENVCASVCAELVCECACLWCVHL